MPELKIVETLAKDIKKGDRIGGRIVETVKNGTKWTEVRDNGTDLIFRTLSTDLFKVHREFPTSAELEAEAIAVEITWRARKCEELEAWVRLQIEEYEERVATQMKKLIDSPAPSSNYCSSVYENLLKLSAERTIAEELRLLHHNWTEMGADWIEVLDAWTEHKREELFTSHSARVFSRSTSTISNLMDDVNREVVINFIERRRYYF